MSNAIGRTLSSIYNITCLSIFFWFFRREFTSNARHERRRRTTWNMDNDVHSMGRRFARARIQLAQTVKSSRKKWRKKVSLRSTHLSSAASRVVLEQKHKIKTVESRPARIVGQKVSGKKNPREWAKRTKRNQRTTLLISCRSVNFMYRRNSSLLGNFSVSAFIRALERTMISSITFIEVFSTWPGRSKLPLITSGSNALWLAYTVRCSPSAFRLTSWSLSRSSSTWISWMFRSRHFSFEALIKIEEAVERQILERECSSAKVSVIRKLDYQFLHALFMAKVLE